MSRSTPAISAGIRRPRRTPARRWSPTRHDARPCAGSCFPADGRGDDPWQSPRRPPPRARPLPAASDRTEFLPTTSSGRYPSNSNTLDWHRCCSARARRLPKSNPPSPRPNPEIDRGRPPGRQLPRSIPIGSACISSAPNRRIQSRRSCPFKSRAFRAASSPLVDSTISPNPQGDRRKGSDHLRPRGDLSVVSTTTLIVRPTFRQRIQRRTPLRPGEQAMPSPQEPLHLNRRGKTRIVPRP